MSDTPPKSNERAIAQQTQEKFELYLLSLVFTLLALAIQTATFLIIVREHLPLYGFMASGNIQLQSRAPQPKWVNVRFLAETRHNQKIV